MRSRSGRVFATAVLVIGTASMGWGVVRLAGTSTSVSAAWYVPERVAAAPAPDDGSSQTPTATPSTTRLLHPAPVSISTRGFWSWALLDPTTGQIVGSPNMGTGQTTASMVKAWLAADYLRRFAEKKTTPGSTALREVSIMIRDSDNTAASEIYDRLGQAASIKRLVSRCGLTDSKAGPGWSTAIVSARDAVRMGRCIADGRAAGPAWTGWLLNEMRNVRGNGRFGIIEALPADVAKATAIKNGWINRADGTWHINCLAIGPDWVLAVETVYPVSLTEAHGHAICKSVTTQLQT